MTIPNFKPEEFSQNLAKEATEFVPADLTEYQKKYVINKLYQFCVLAGNALNQDTSVSFTVNEANVIVQLIGEWTFHKNIDLIRAKIPEDCWDPILQQVAFAVFETAKQVETDKVERDKALSLIENVVKESYSKSLMELSANGKIKADDIPDMLNYSNIDSMAAQPQSGLSKEHEDRFLKCASLALVLKSMPQDKVNKILSGFDQTVAQQILYCINTPDLEQKIDTNTANNILAGFMQTFSVQDSSQQRNTPNRISALKDLYQDNSILKCIKYERSHIQQFVQSSLHPEKVNSKINISPFIEKVLYDYLVSKLAS